MTGRRPLKTPGFVRALFPTDEHPFVMPPPTPPPPLNALPGGVAAAGLPPQQQGQGQQDPHQGGAPAVGADGGHAHEE